MSMIHKLGLVFFLFGLSACSTIHFTNGPESGDESRSRPYSNWHHVGILELVEFSDPVDLAQNCEGNNWSSTTTEMGVPHSLIYLFVGAFYSPWDVKYSCRGGASAPMMSKPMMGKPMPHKGKMRKKRRK